jgi:hypothetical protein
MVYVSHAWFNAITGLSNQLEKEGWKSTRSFNEAEKRYELVTDAPREVVEKIIYSGNLPRELLEKAYIIEGD